MCFYKAVCDKEPFKIYLTECILGKLLINLDALAVSPKGSNIYRHNFTELKQVCARAAITRRVKYDPKVLPKRY